MAEVAVSMEITKHSNKSNPTPQEVQGGVGDLVKQFSLMIQTINTPGLTGPDLLKVIQEHQKSQDVGMKKP